MLLMLFFNKLYILDVVSFWFSLIDGLFFSIVFSLLFYEALYNTNTIITYFLNFYNINNII
jgi:hypothetical protein